MEEMRILKVLSNELVVPHRLPYAPMTRLCLLFSTGRPIVYRCTKSLNANGIRAALRTAKDTRAPPITAAPSMSIHLPDPTQQQCIRDSMGPSRHKMLYSSCEMHFSSKSSGHPYACPQLDSTVRNGAYMHVEVYSSSTMRQRRLTSTQNPL
jgi:hypothetical protein